MEIPEDGVSHYTVWAEHQEGCFTVEHSEKSKGNIGDKKEKKGI